ncbi:MAG: hypothetical protein LUE17_15585 [Planctomycetaceae bacterium]|nr:hypothetical protein [Planctomycetaceae bacterium]
MAKTRRVFPLVIPVLLAAWCGIAPAQDGSAYVGYGWNGYLPAIQAEDGTLIPYLPVSFVPPADYVGDYYVDEFTDAKIKQLYLDLKERDPSAAGKALSDTQKDVDNQFRWTGLLDPFGKIDPHGDVDIRAIRRPGYFGRAPYHENIALAENSAWTVEFTVPADPYEKTKGMADELKLRGWYLEGSGVRGPDGRLHHALVVLFSGYTIELTAAQHPDDPLYYYDWASKEYTGIPYPNPEGRTEKWGVAPWRDYIYTLWRAGFDVLTVDKRAHGISGGANPRNVNAVSDDFFRMLDALESGNGLTILGPDGEIRRGGGAAGVLTRGYSAKELPVMVGGPSHGSMITSYVAHKNFVGYEDMGGDMSFTPARGYTIKAVFLLGSFAGGPGYLGNTSRNMVESIYRNEFGIVYRPTSEVLANIHTWPAAVFIGKGLWDEHESAPGTYETYRRATGLKELVFVRGPHSENEFGPENLQYMKDKLAAFAVDALVNPDAYRPEYASFREAVEASPDYWEPSAFTRQW